MLTCIGIKGSLKNIHHFPAKINCSTCSYQLDVSFIFHPTGKSKRGRDQGASSLEIHCGLSSNRVFSACLIWLWACPLLPLLFICFQGRGRIQSPTHAMQMLCLCTLRGLVLWTVTLRCCLLEVCRNSSSSSSNKPPYAAYCTRHWSKWFYICLLGACNHTGWQSSMPVLQMRRPKYTEVTPEKPKGC